MANIIITGSAIVLKSDLTLDTIKKLKKDSVITEDDQKAAENELQKVTDAHIKDLDRIGADKEKEIMSV